MKFTICISRRLLPLQLSLLISMLGFFCFRSPSSAQPSIPTPRGYVEVSSQSQDVLRVATAGMPPGQKLIGFYFTTNSAQEIISTGYAPTSPFCKALVFKSLASNQEARVAFKDLVAEAKREMPADRSREEIDRIFQHYEKAANQLKEGVAVEILGAEFLGSFVETKKIYGFSMLASYSRKEKDGTFNMPFALANVWILDGTQILQLNVAFPFRSISDLESPKNELLLWIEDVQKAQVVPVPNRPGANADALLSLQEASGMLDVWSKDQVTPVVLVEPYVGGFAPKDGSRVGNTWSKNEVKAVVLVKPGVMGYEPLTGSSIGNTWSKSDVLPVLVVAPSTTGFSSYITSSDSAYQRTSQVPSISVTGGKSSVVETSIKGAFKGWDGNTVVELMNGQIWKQSEYYYEYHYAYHPSVTIYPDGGSFKMKVEGVNRGVGVSRLK